MKSVTPSQSAQFGWLKKTDLLFYLVFGLLGLAAFAVIRPYIVMFLVALVMVLVCEPIYDWFVRKVQNPMLASALTTTLFFAVIITPVILLSMLAVNQALEWAHWLQQFTTATPAELRGYFGVAYWSGQPWFQPAEQFLLQNQTMIADLFSSLAKTSSALVAANVGSVLGSGLRAIINVVFFVATMIYLFPAKTAFFTELAAINPLEHSLYERFMVRFVVVTKATMGSLLVVAVLQGALGAFIYYVTGVGSPVLLGVLQALVSFIPIGSGLLWIPVALVQLFMGRWVAAVIIILWGTFVISVADNIVRPMLLQSGESQLPPLVTMFSALGGLKLFGFWGFLFGPLICALFLTALEVYKERKDSQ